MKSLVRQFNLKPTKTKWPDQEKFALKPQRSACPQSKYQNLKLYSKALLAFTWTPPSRGLPSPRWPTSRSTATATAQASSQTDTRAPSKPTRNLTTLMKPRYLTRNWLRFLYFPTESLFHESSLFVMLQKINSTNKFLFIILYELKHTSPFGQLRKENTGALSHTKLSRSPSYLPFQQTKQIM